MKTICYISNFADALTKEQINDLIKNVNSANTTNGISGVLIIRNKHFFQIIEGQEDIVNILYSKIKKDNRHKGIITLLDSKIEDRIFKDYNSGQFETFQRYSNMKKLYLYFNWIKEANYLPADKLIQLTTNFLKFNK